MPIQFNISREDADDFLALVGEDSKAPVAKKLFLYGLNHPTEAFKEYAAPHEARRRKRVGQVEPTNSN